MASASVSHVISQHTNKRAHDFFEFFNGSRESRGTKDCFLECKRVLLNSREFLESYKIKSRNVNAVLPEFFKKYSRLPYSAAINWRSWLLPNRHRADSVIW